MRFSLVLNVIDDLPLCYRIQSSHHTKLVGTHNKLVRLDRPACQEHPMDAVLYVPLFLFSVLLPLLLSTFYTIKIKNNCIRIASIVWNLF